MHAIGYARVSTAEQRDNGASLDVQRAELTAAAELRGWTLDVLEDAAHSARDLERPAILDALGRLERGAAGALIVAKLDRLSRSLYDFAGIMETARRQGWIVVALDCAVDTSTPAGEMMANVLATFAHFERRLIGQRTRDGLAAKRAAGVRLGRPPLLPDLVRSRIVAEHARGASLASIARGLDADQVPTVHGGRRWWPSTVRAALVAS